MQLNSSITSCGFFFQCPVFDVISTMTGLWTRRSEFRFPVEAVDFLAPSKRPDRH